MSDDANFLLSVVAATEDPADVDLMSEIQATLMALNFPVVPQIHAERFLVCSTKSGLALRSDAIDGAVRIHSRPHGPYKVSRRDPLGRAVGRSHNTVVDATAGLGGDVLLLVEMGFEVTAIEYSPLLYVILRDRLQHALSKVAGSSVALHCGDSQLTLGEIKPPPEVVLLDPMFPPRRKTSALPKKEMVELRTLAYESSDPARLLEVALGTATKRVIVKRLPESPPLAGPPDWSHAAKTVRYDVYACPGSSSA